MCGKMSKGSQASVAACALCLVAAGWVTAPRDAFGASLRDPRQEEPQKKGFYCNIKALTLAERARHGMLTAKLLANRANTVETEKGYEFQYRAGTVTLAELAQWAATESKCCPFFDFHIDLENEGQLLCLRLTGQEGIKQFIRAEFHLAGKTS